MGIRRPSEEEVVLGIHLVWATETYLCVMHPSRCVAELLVVQYGNDFQEYFRPLLWTLTGRVTKGQGQMWCHKTESVLGSWRWKFVDVRETRSLLNRVSKVVGAWGPTKPEPSP